MVIVGVMLLFILFVFIKWEGENYVMWFMEWVVWFGVVGCVVDCVVVCVG